MLAFKCFPRPECDIRCQIGPRRAIVVVKNRSVAHACEGCDSGFDIPEFDPVASDFNLRVATSK